jgi:hypothetical protein
MISPGSIVMTSAVEGNLTLLLRKCILIQARYKMYKHLRGILGNAPLYAPIPYRYAGIIMRVYEKSPSRQFGE